MKKDRMTSPIANYRKHQLFCSIPTKRIPRSDFSGQSFVADTLKYSLAAKKRSFFKPRGTVFKNYETDNKDLFYLCEYIPENKDGKRNDYLDSRSRNVVLGFKHGQKEVIHYVALKLLEELADGCALVAVPPSHVSKNGMSAAHELIREITTSQIGRQKGLIDGSDCLVRTCDIPPAHNGGKRSPEVQAHSLELRNWDILRGKHVLLIDDVVTTGTSMAVCQELMESLTRSVVCFAVGKTIYNENLKVGFIFDLDGTLFDTEKGDIQLARQKAMRNRNWDEVIALAKKMKPLPGVMELLAKVKERNCEYRIVTSSPKKYVRCLADILGVDDSHLITYEDTDSHKPNIDPYMLAKAQMGLYEEEIIAIGDKDYIDMVPAVALGMTGVLIGSSSKEPGVLSYPFIEDVVDHFSEITARAEAAWHNISSEYVKDNVSSENANQTIYFEKVLQDMKQKYPDVAAIEPITYLVALYNDKRLIRSDVKRYHDEILSQTDPIKAYEYYASRIPVTKPQKLPMSIPEFCDRIYTLQKNIDEQKANGVQVMDSSDPCFPKALKDSKEGPDYLFYKGKPELLAGRSVSVFTPKVTSALAYERILHFTKLAIQCRWNVVYSSLIDTSSFRKDEDWDDDLKEPGVCLVISERPLYNSSSEYQRADKIAERGGVIFSIALPSLMINETDMKEDTMKLSLDFSYGVIAFGHKVPKNNMAYINKKTYYGLLHNYVDKCCKLVGYFEFTSHELEEHPEMRINEDLWAKDFEPKPISSDIDVYRFLATLK